MMTPTEQKDGRSGKGTKPDAVEPAAVAAPRTPDAEIEEAGQALRQALHAAWEEAVRQSSLAEMRSNIARQQIVLKTQSRCVSADQEWAGAMQGVDPSSQSPSDALAGAGERYHGSVNSAVKEGQDQWEAACREHRDAVARAGETYREAVEEAIGAYVARLKSLWSVLDPKEICPNGLWRLAQATGWAANVAAAVARR